MGTAGLQSPSLLRLQYSSVMVTVRESRRSWGSPSPREFRRGTDPASSWRRREQLPAQCFSDLVGGAIPGSVAWGCCVRRGGLRHSPGGPATDPADPQAALGRVLEAGAQNVYR